MRQWVQRAILRTAILTLVAGFVLGLVTRGAWMLNHLSFRPAPQVQLQAMGALAGLPLLQDVPNPSTWLWVPGVDRHVSRKILQQYPEIGTVTFEKHVIDNRIVMRVAPRVPVAQWTGQAIDHDGVVFAMPANAHKAVPEIALAANDLSTVERQWIGALSRSASFWAHVKRVRRNPQSEMILDVDSGAQVVWGLPDLASVARKAQYLERVLDDAHERLG